MYQKLHKALRLACQLNLCNIDFRRAGFQKVLLVKLASVGLHKGFFASARQFIRDSIAKDYRAVDACKDNMVIEMIHEGTAWSWDGYGHKVDRQFVLNAELILHVDESAKKYFFGLLEGLNKPGTYSDARQERSLNEQENSVQTFPSQNDIGGAVHGDKEEHGLPAKLGDSIVSGKEEEHYLTDEVAVQDDAVFRSMGKALAEAVLKVCEPEKVKRFARDIGFKGEYISFEREYVYLVMFLQATACEISFVEDMHDPIMDSYHRYIYENKFGLPPDAAKTGQFEAELKTRYRQYHELAVYKAGKVNTELLLAELPYHFLAHALNKNREEATYFMSRQKLCTHLNPAGFQFLKKFIEGLLASSITINDSLLTSSQ